MITVNPDTISTELLDTVSFSGVRQLGRSIEREINHKMEGVFRELATLSFSWDQSGIVNDLHNYRKIHHEWNRRIKLPAKNTLGPLIGLLVTSIAGLINTDMDECDPGLKPSLGTILTISSIFIGLVGTVAYKFDRKYIPYLLTANQRGYIDPKLQLFFENLKDLKNWNMLNTEDLVKAISGVHASYNALSSDAKKIMPDHLKWNHALNQIISMRNIENVTKNSFMKFRFLDPIPSSMIKLDSMYLWTLSSKGKIVKDRLDKVFTLISDNIDNADFSLNINPVRKNLNRCRKIFTIQNRQIIEMSFYTILFGATLSFAGFITVILAYSECSNSSENINLWKYPMIGLALDLIVAPIHMLFSNKDFLERQGSGYVSKKLPEFIDALARISASEDKNGKQEVDKNRAESEKEDIKIVINEAIDAYDELPLIAKNLFPLHTKQVLSRIINPIQNDNDGFVIPVWRH